MDNLQFNYSQLIYVSIGLSGAIITKLFCGLNNPDPRPTIVQWINSIATCAGKVTMWILAVLALASVFLFIFCQTYFCGYSQTLQKCKEKVIQLLEQKKETGSDDRQLQRFIHAWRAISDEKYLKAFLSVTESFFKGMSTVQQSKEVQGYTGGKYSSMYTDAKELADYLTDQLNDSRGIKTIVSKCASAKPRKRIRVELPEVFVKKLRKYRLLNKMD